MWRNTNEIRLTSETPPYEVENNSAQVSIETIREDVLNRVCLKYATTVSCRHRVIQRWVRTLDTNSTGTVKPASCTSAARTDKGEADRKASPT